MGLCNTARKWATDIMKYVITDNYTGINPDSFQVYKRSGWIPADKPFIADEFKILLYADGDGNEIWIEGFIDEGLFTVPSLHYTREDGEETQCTLTDEQSRALSIFVTYYEDDNHFGELRGGV